jgi:hypothetical protein
VAVKNLRQAEFARTQQTLFADSVRS